MVMADRKVRGASAPTDVDGLMEDMMRALQKALRAIDIELVDMGAGIARDDGGGQPELLIFGSAEDMRSGIRKRFQYPIPLETIRAGGITPVKASDNIVYTLEEEFKEARIMNVFGLA